MPLQINALLEWPVGEAPPRINRILWMDETGIGTWMIDIKDEKAWPVFQRGEEVETAIANGEARLIQRLDKYLTKLLPDDEYLKKHDHRAKKNYALIAPLVETADFRIYHRRYRGRMVTEVAERTGRRKAQIYEVLRRYWQGGCIPNAVLPDYHNSGNVKDRKDRGKKRGRPNNRGRNVTAEDREKFRLGVDDFKNTGITKTLPDTWKRTKEKYFNIGYREIPDGTLVPILPPAEELPTLRQFKYEYYKTRNPKAEIVAVDGEKEFECNNRPILGDETLTAVGPGAVYQIDASIGDIYLRCYLNRKNIIGRPVIYLVVDVFSRLIVGFAVTLEGPSWAGARLALENAFCDKVSYCKQFGIDISQAEWPPMGKCEGLVGDNGEIAGYNANSLVDPLGIRVATAPTGRPDLKGIVESRFLIIKRLSIEWVPGAVRPYRKRRGKDYRLDACLDLNQFRRLMIECIRTYNNSRRLEGYRMSIPMIAAGVEPIPIKIWNWGMSSLIGKLRHEDPDVISMNLLPSGTATVTPEGIRFRVVHYTCERALQEQWFLRLKGKRSKRVNIVYESSVDRIHLRLERGKRYESCVLSKADERFRGLDWYELLEYFALKKKAAAAAETDQQQAAAELHARADRILYEAEEMNRAALADDHRSKTARTNGISKNRQALKLHERKHGTTGARQVNAPDQPASVIPINRGKSSDGYVPPARPYGIIRKAREEAKRRENR